MNSKTKTGGIIILLFCLFAICSCQPTPDAPIVQSKGDGTLQSKIASEPLPESQYEAASEWNEEVKPNENLIINITAQIDVPNVTQYPVYRVKDSDISDTELNSILSYMIGEKDIYTWDSDEEEAVSESVLKRRIAAAEYQLYDQNSLYHKYVLGKNSEYSESEQKQAEDSLLYTLSSSKEKLNRMHGDTWIKAEKTMQNATEDGFTAKTDDCNSTVFLQKRLVTSEQAVICSNNIFGIGYDHVFAEHSSPYNLNISLDECKKLAQDAAEAAGFKGWSIACIGSALPLVEDMVEQSAYMWGAYTGDPSEYEDKIIPTDKLPGCYYFVLTPSYNGVPLLYYCNNEQKHIPLEIQKILANRIFYQPSLHIAIDDRGVISMELRNGIEVTDTINENVELVPFDEIQAIFRKQITLSPYYSYIYDRTGYEKEPFHEKTIIDINSIRLGYMRTIEKDNDTSLLIPVWMFYGVQHDYYTGGSEGSTWKLNKEGERVIDTPIGHAFMIINAIDGSIIDPYMGY